MAPAAGWRRPGGVASTYTKTLVSEVQFEDVVLLLFLQVVGTRQNGPAHGTDKAQVSGMIRPSTERLRTDPIFEGTSEIQRLVVARTISGVHIP